MVSKRKSDAKTNPAIIIGILAVCLLVGLFFVTLKAKRKAPVATPEVVEIVNPDEIRAKAEGGDAEAQKKL